MLEDDDAPAVEEAQEAAPEQPAAETQPETEATQAEPETQDEGTEAKTEEPIRQPKIERRVAHLTRVANEAQRERDEARRELEATKALLQQGNGGQQPTPPQPNSRDEIVAEAQRIVAEERVRERRQVVIDAGVKEFGAETWNERTTMLHSMGALGRPEFMEALVDIPEAHHLVAHLADDPDQLAALLAKRPAAMAAAMGRMAAELSVAEAAKPKEISKAPPPVKPVGAGRAQPAPNLEKMSARDFIEFRNRTAPKHLGGQGKAA